MASGIPVALITGVVERAPVHAEHLLELPALDQFRNRVAAAVSARFR
jgi:hypothetical protein